MFENWLKEALEKAHLSQAELARALTSSLGRSIDKNAINKILSGNRKLYADELLEVSRICDVPLPFERRMELKKLSTIELYMYLCHALLVNAPWITDTEGVRAIANVLVESIQSFLMRYDVEFEEDMETKDVFDPLKLLRKPGTG